MAYFMTRPLISQDPFDGTMSGPQSPFGHFVKGERFVAPE